jgi:hypothetical protein
MGSSSAPPTEEEMAATKATNNATATEMANKDQYYVTSTGNSSGSGAVPQEGMQIHNMSDDGLSFMGVSGHGNPSPYTYNPQTGMYHQEGGNAVSLGQVETQTQAPTSSGGGGGKPPPKKPGPGDDKPPPWNPPPGTDPDQSGTNQSLGDQNVESMLGYEPISSDGEGGTQNLNPLADANNWLHIEDPKYKTPTYSNPPGGQSTSSTSSYDVNATSQMDYAKTPIGLLSPEEEALMAAGLLG